MADKEPLEILEKISDMYDYAHDALKQFPRDERYAQKAPGVLAKRRARTINPCSVAETRESC